ncbi:MAG: bifunctional diaminohydroxyphosphoribosylaminopyrimidine deaminase/5-amino-6-(5-phosphoribosylamino)uracil reductase RibD [Sedimentisphaerales bacterium]|nr:bifunctional diaminohydroxyphosphoribosylaminopyrimidine deaminase/5-amino-6-(5-phosphoribosylamino)uracil reductase RibD [Sedimentisphaerales bacterium]
MNQDERIMGSALRLARRGIGSVEPNPAVGCVIVKGGKVIGKGRHRKFGGPHAEINALEDCKKSGNDPRVARMYVTLEPCCHRGKTGPCTQAIISAGPAKVFVAMIDPSEHACGKGIEQLRKSGIEVQVGICETEARLLNAPFIKYASTGKCWVTLKWAQSIDGKLAITGPRISGSNWISGEKSRKDVHKLRRRAAGILVGVNTVIADDPLLTARPSRGKKATRIVLDGQLRIPPDSKLINTAKRHPLLVYTREGAVQARPKIAEKITKKCGEVLIYPQTQGGSYLHFLIDELSKRGIGHLLVEGGPKVLTSFLKEGLADEIIVYIAPKILGAQGCADITEQMAELTQAIGLHYVDMKRFGDDIRLTGLTTRAIGEISVPFSK